MDARKKQVRTERVKKLNSILRALYPTAKSALNYKTEFECLVTVQLSAQCTDKRVNDVTKTLFKKYRTVDDYARARQKTLERVIYPCGFYRNKTKNIIAAAKMVKDHFGGSLPHTMEEMLRIPGVARKTANVVLANLYGLSEGVAVDTHVRRFALRFDLTDYTEPVKIERDLMEIMPQEEWQGFNHRLVYYGREYCPARKHDCTKHPLTVIYPRANKIWPRASLDDGHISKVVRQ